VGFVKLNVDAPFDHDELRGTIGVVLRDDRGKFIAGGNGKIDWCTDVLAAEALVLRYGLSMAQRMGWNRLVINSDNLEVIETMTMEDVMWAQWRRFSMIVIISLVIFLFLGLNDWLEEPLNEIITSSQMMYLFYLMNKVGGVLIQKIHD
jgi:hypothetical protein